MSNSIFDNPKSNITPADSNQSAGVTVGIGLDKQTNVIKKEQIASKVQSGGCGCGKRPEGKRQ